MATAKQQTEQENRERAMFEQALTRMSPWLQKILREKSDGRVVEVPLDQIYESYDVRFEDTDTHSDRVEAFADIYTSPAYAANPLVLPPVFLELATGTETDHDDNNKLIPDCSYIVNEGRHRRRGGKKGKLTALYAIILMDLTERERKIIATGANCEPGPLRPTFGELVQQAQMLAKPIEDGGTGMTSPELRKEFGKFCTKSELVRIVRNVESNLKDIRLKRAVKFYLDEDLALSPKQRFPIIEAKWGIKKSTVLNVVDPERRGKRKAEKSEQVKGISGGLERGFVSLGGSIDRQMKKMIEFYMEGGIDGADATDVDAMYQYVQTKAMALARKASKNRLKFKQNVQFGTV